MNPLASLRPLPGSGSDLEPATLIDDTVIHRELDSAGVEVGQQAPQRRGVDRSRRQTSVRAATSLRCSASV